MRRPILFFLIIVLITGCLSGCANNRIDNTKEETAELSPQSSHEATIDDHTNKVAVWLLSEFTYETENSISVDTYTYDAQGNQTKIVEQEDGKEKWSECIYDENNRKKEIVYYEYGKPQTRRTFVYDDCGNLVEELAVYVRGGQIKDKTRFFYDENGNLVNREYYYNDTVSTTTYTYDDQGNEIQNIYTAADGTVTKTTTVYDSQKNVVENTRYTNGILDYQYMYHLNEAGKVIKKTEDNGKEVKTSTYKYDGQGNEVEYRSGTFKSKSKYISNRLVKTEFYSNGSLFTTDTYEYDNDGNLSKYIRKGDFLTEIEEYSYDNGKLISIVSTTGGKTTKTITYRYTKIFVTKERAGQLEDMYSKDSIYIES